MPTTSITSAINCRGIWCLVIACQIALALCSSLVSLMKVRSRCNSSFDDSVSSRDLLRKVKDALSSTNRKRFTERKQEVNSLISYSNFCFFKDANEFLSAVLDQLKDEIDQVARDSDFPIENPVFVNFGFALRHEIRCEG
jgi:uncharacterized membrane protein YvbJ